MQKVCEFINLLRIKPVVLVTPDLANDYEPSAI